MPDRTPLLFATDTGAQQPPIPIGEHWLQTGSGLLTINWDTIILTWLVIAIIIVPLIILSRNFTSGVPRGFQAVYEFVVEFVNGYAEQSLGSRSAALMPLALTIFVFILISNYLGLIPIPYLKSPTSDLNTTLALGIFTFILVQALAIRERGLGGHFHHLTRPIPVFFLINVIDELARPVTLAFRLFGNIVAGEIMILILQALLYNAPFLLLLPMPIWLGFSLFIGLIQAFIFMMLFLAYVGLAVEHEPEEERHGEALGTAPARQGHA
jgi:F-type H+-transporting ATPase subunit a